MRIPAKQLDGQLQRGLAPLYLVSGDEPLQLGETLDAIRREALRQGYGSREVLDVDQHFDWNRLAAEADALSLFAERRVIDLRIPSGKPGNEGSKALLEYAQRPPEDTLLLLTLPKLDRSQQSSKWFKALDRLGVVIQIWPIELAQLPGWIEQRMRSAGLQPERGVAAMLAESVEGNLLAARQEIEKLLLLFGSSPIDQQRLSESVADSARFDIFGLVDSALDGDIGRSLRMLNGLRAEGTPEPLVLWALTRELRLLCSLAWELRRGRSARQAVAARREVWEKRKPLVAKGLQRLAPAQWRQLLRQCGETDQAIKGFSKADPWLLLQRIVTGMAGAEVG
ncbi:MAG: DNA polymerase III subunit delta [Gammaproteobacteria bacterium]|nr:DNA polymerase III subunit delta [Gammaproteobacteria bacterium]